MPPSLMPSRATRVPFLTRFSSLRSVKGPDHKFYNDSGASDPMAGGRP